MSNAVGCAGLGRAIAPMAGNSVVSGCTAGTQSVAYMGFHGTHDSVVDISSGRTARDVFVTRMHVRYDAQHFPEDLVLQETADRNNFQARYVLRHPWKGYEECPANDEHRRELMKRNENEARQLAELTGWNLTDIRAQMNLRAADPNGETERAWWQKLWNR